MKKILAVVLCLVIITSLVGCGTNITSMNSSSESSPKEKYDHAVNLFTEKKYDEAINILENIDYENSKELKESIAYVYACELFNKQEFSSAYNYFKKAENHPDSQKNMNRSAYYEGIKLINKDQHWKSIDWFRKVLSDDEFKSIAEKHIIAITTDLIGNAWFGSYTNSNGVTLQIEFKYFENKDNLYIAHADRSNGYKQVASLSGSLEVGAEKSKYYHSETTFGGTWDAIEFSFSSADRMYVYCSAKSIGKAITGSYTAKNIPTVYYKIDNISFPNLIIPEINITDNVFNNNDSTSLSSMQSVVLNSNESNQNNNLLLPSGTTKNDDGTYTYKKYNAGILSDITIYYDNHQKKKQTYYFEDGSMKSENFFDKSGKLIKQVYYEKGKIERIRDIVKNQTTQYTYFSNGNILLEECWQDNILIKRIQYYSNGKVRTRIEGDSEGNEIVRYYDENGNEKSTPQ